MALMCPVGFLLGYGFAKVVIGADARTARTVSMETGIQQVGIAGAIAIQTFKGQALDKAIATIAVRRGVRLDLNLQRRRGDGVDIVAATPSTRIYSTA